ncbi:hypothetical protein WJ42_08475 [Burkholderia cepacia]|nr:hypothetical protein WJ42_08475 [Burkholderia cepacia]KWC72172.1 hypothetical protein WL55_05925 [Burkholderia cepacia]
MQTFAIPLITIAGLSRYFSGDGGIAVCYWKSGSRSPGSDADACAHRVVEIRGCVRVVAGHDANANAITIAKISGRRPRCAA